MQTNGTHACGAATAVAADFRRSARKSVEFKFEIRRYTGAGAEISRLTMFAPGLRQPISYPPLELRRRQGLLVWASGGALG